MYRALKVLVAGGAVLVAGCGDSSRISSDLQNDLALASVGADLELASRSTDEMRVVGAVERTTPPSRAIASSARAPRPRRSPTPQITADVQEETEYIEESEVAAKEEPMPAPAPVQELPVEIASSTGNGPVSSGGAGTGSRGSDWGTLIGIAGAVVLRGGDVGVDRCIPPSESRSRTSTISQRFPVPQGRGTGRVAMGGGRTGGQVTRTAPPRPRDISSRPGASQSSSTMRPMPSGGSAGSTATTASEGRSTANGDFQ